MTVYAVSIVPYLRRQYGRDIRTSLSPVSGRLSDWCQPWYTGTTPFRWW